MSEFDLVIRNGTVVTATDTYGNAGTDGTTFELDVDATAPTVTILKNNKKGPEFNIRAFDIVCGGGNQIRTGEWRFCRPLPYHLAMPPL